MSAAASSSWAARRRAVFDSVFHTDMSQPTPHSTPRSTPSGMFPDLGQSFGAPPTGQASLFGKGATRGDGDVFGEASLSIGAPTIPASSLLSPSSRNLFSGHAAAEDQVSYDRAWHVVTSRLVLPSSVTAEDSFGTLAPDSQFHSQDDEAEFHAALRLVLHASELLPGAAHTEDVLSWHTQQVRRHFVQHVTPLLSALSGPAMLANQGHAGNDDYDSHMVVVQSSVQTLQAALRQYFYCLSLIVRGLQREGNDAFGGEHGSSVEEGRPLTPGVVVALFRRDIYALVSNAALPPFMASLRAVLVRLISATLEMPAVRSTAHLKDRKGLSATLEPGRSVSDSIKADAARKRLLELVDALSGVGLAGERFQILFAEIMDGMMTEYVHRSYARVWKSPEKPQAPEGLDKRAARSTNMGSAASWCISSLCDWVENHYARLALEVLSGIQGASGKHEPGPVSLPDVKKWKEIGIGRLAALRISELYDIVLHWPASRGGLDDLRVSVTTPQRRLQLTDAFSVALERRLLHPACSTLEILRVYIAMIRTFHALDNSKVLLSRVVSSLQIYLCQRDDAVRIVVNGLLASPEEVKQAQLDVVMAESSTAHETQDATSAGEGGKLVELAASLNDPSQQRRQHVDDEELDWDDMDWLPDPVDAGVNYRRPKSEDVVGTLISALGSKDVFIKEFQSIVAERLLSGQSTFDQEIKVLNLLKRRFGESALQNCDVMIKDIYDSRRVDAVIHRITGMQASQQQPLPRVLSTPTTPSGPAARQPLSQGEPARDLPGRVPYNARILSRLYWPNIVHDTFLLPNPVAEQQALYNKGYERLKSSRKLAWLDHLGQATVELELKDRTLVVDCRTYAATVIYAFQDADAPDDADAPPVRRTPLELQEMLRMDEELVLQALEFWESRNVLRQAEGEAYVVVESQEAAQPASSHRPGLLTSASAPAAMEGDAARKPAKERSGATGAMDARERERRQLYWQYVVGLLTNSMPTAPLGQIAMMLKMLISEGFAWSNEELQEFLSEKVGEGELEVAGGKYKLAKK